jgi:hypothetical protein
MAKRFYLIICLGLILASCENDTVVLRDNKTDLLSKDWTVDSHIEIAEKGDLEVRSALKETFINGFLQIFNKNPGQRNAVEKKYGLPVLSVVEVLDADDRIVAFVPFATKTSKLIEAEMFVIYYKTSDKLVYKIYEPKDVGKLQKKKDNKPNANGKYSELDKESLAQAFTAHNAKIFNAVSCEHLAIVEAGITGEQSLESRDVHTVCRTPAYLVTVHIPTNQCNTCYITYSYIEYGPSSCITVYGNPGTSTGGTNFNSSGSTGGTGTATNGWGYEDGGTVAEKTYCGLNYDDIIITTSFTNCYAINCVYNKLYRSGSKMFCNNIVSNFENNQKLDLILKAGVLEWAGEAQVRINENSGVVMTFNNSYCNNSELKHCSHNLTRIGSCKI